MSLRSECRGTFRFTALEVRLRDVAWLLKSQCGGVWHGASAGTVLEGNETNICKDSDEEKAYGRRVFMIVDHVKRGRTVEKTTLPVRHMNRKDIFAILKNPAR